MFDVGFPELIVIAIVALVVLGPERLPKAARFVGLWVRRARSQWDSVKNELERELAAEELKRNLQEAQDALRRTDEAMRRSHEQAQDQFEQARSEVLGAAHSAMDEPPAAVSGLPATADTALQDQATVVAEAHPAATDKDAGDERPHAS